MWVPSRATGSPVLSDEVDGDVAQAEDERQSQQDGDDLDDDDEAGHSCVRLEVVLHLFRLSFVVCSCCNVPVARSLPEELHLRFPHQVLDPGSHPRSSDLPSGRG